jgi:hypothetical protein
MGAGTGGIEVMSNSEPQYTIFIQEYSEWQCEIFPGTRWTALKGKEPNWFWRKMQFLILGFRWVNTEKEMQTKVQECPEPAESLQNIPAASMYTTDSGDVKPRPETEDFSGL